MKSVLLPLLLFALLSCSSRAQETLVAPATADTLASPSPARLTLLFVGDLMQHKGQIDAARTSTGYDYSDCFRLVKEEISSADIAIGNLEVTLGGTPYNGYPAFSAPDDYLTAIHNAGFDVLMTANNHCLDRGKRGLERTIQQLDAQQMKHAGTYIHPEARAQQFPLMLEQNGFRIALLNYTYGTNGIAVTPPNVVNFINKESIKRDIETTKAQHPDAIIAYMHWGEEYQSLPSQEQTQLADWLIQQGITHIIGSHPHVAQPLSVRTDSLTGNRHAVVYSLGNFISNMSAKRTDGGLLVKLHLEKDSTSTRLVRCEYSLVYTARPVLSRQKNYTLYPINYPSDSLNTQTLNRMNIFVKEARSLFNKHNNEVSEYTFY